VEREGKYYQVDATDGLYEIHTTGLGCALIDMNWVKEHLRPPWFIMKHTGRSTNITDDITFFEMIRAAGGKTLGDASVSCGHLGHRKIINRRNASLLRKEHMELYGEDGEAVKRGCGDELVAVPPDASMALHPLPPGCEYVSKPKEKTLNMEDSWSPDWHVIKKVEAEVKKGE
jgi:hypothetical protein